MDQELTLKDYISIIKRRYLWLILPFVLVFSIAIVVSLVIPPVYRSTGTILVESQQIPDDLVKSTVTSFADERIEIIKQRVMTRERLMQIDRKFGLSEQENADLSVSEIVDLVRGNIGIELVSADVGGKRRAKATIAFRVSYEHREAAVAQRVANELVTLFLDENVRSRTERASETTDFLAQESRRLKLQLDTIEEQISSFKQENSEALPEHLSMRIGMLERAEKDLKEVERDIKASEQERRFLEIELSSVKTGTTVADNNNRVKTPAEQLAEYRLQLTDLKAVYRASHPDIKYLERKIVELQKMVDPAAIRPFLEAEWQEAKQELAAARSKYGDDSPDVKRLNSKVAGIEQSLSGLPNSAEDEPQSTNPAVARVQAQIAALDSRVLSLNEQEASLKKRIESLQAAIMQTPQVERALTALARDHENALRKYEEVRAKEMQAQLAENLEEDRKAERFSLLEPPVTPDKPVKPNRKKMVALGFVLAVASGGGGLFLIESIDGGIRGPAGLARAVNHTPLASIPYLHTAKDAVRRRRRIWLLAAAAILLAVIALVLLHYFYMPLDLLMIKVMARFD